MRGSCVCVPELFHIIWFWEGYAVSQSVLHHFFSLKAHFQCIQVLFEGTEETSGAHHSILKIFHIIWFWGLCCISVSFPLFFIIEGVFTMYSSPIQKAQE